MFTFFMYGNYTSEALNEISADRTRLVVTGIHEAGGKVRSMYALLGDSDLVFIVDFPDIAQAIKTSITLTNLTGIAFSTTAALPVEEFDAMMEEL
ncbi:MAG: GYD domain-containing protein [Candidatus Neomarinimicrobiota bacterium]